MENVVIAVDGSAAAQSALDWVLERSRSHEMSLEVVAVQEPVSADDPFGSSPGSASIAVNEDDFLPVYESMLQVAAARIRDEAPGLSVRTVLRRGRPRIELAQAAAHADLLVIGSPRRGHFAGAFAGTLPLRLAATVRCTTVVVPEGWVAADGPVKMGLDVTRVQPSVVRFAESEARDGGGGFTVIHAWNVPTLVAVAMLAQTGVWRSMEESRHTAMLRIVAGMRRENPDLGIREVLREGPAARVLADEATDAGLLVIGRRGHGAEDVLLGATAHSLLLDMPCPIAVVPAAA